MDGMIEITTDLMATLQAEAARRGSTVSELANRAIKEWIGPAPWTEVDAPSEPPRHVELPAPGGTYRSGGGDFSIQVKTVELAYEPLTPPAVITILHPKEWGSEEMLEWRMTGHEWMELCGQFGFTLESASNQGITRVFEKCIAAEISHEQHD